MAQAAELVREPAPHDVHHSLRADSIRLVGTVANAIGIQAPSAGAAILPALMAEVVGGAGPMAFGLAIIAMLFVAYAFMVFTREFSSASSVFAFNGTAMGSSYGFISAWLLLGVYISYAASTYCFSAVAAVALLDSAGLHVAWPIIAVAIWAFATALAYRSISVSSVVIFAAEGIALALVAIVAIVVIGKGGYNGSSLSLTPFTTNGAALTTIGLGVIFAFTGFSGFEVSATLGEEASHSKRIVPLAIIIALLVSGGVYTLISWVCTVAFPNAAALSHSSVPLVDVAGRFIGGPMGTFVNIAILFSAIGAPLACLNGATRLVFALARDGGFGPRKLTTTHPRHRSPVFALAVTSVLSLAAFLPLTGGTPLNAFFDIATAGADMVIVAYLMTIVAALVWSIRHHRRPLRILTLCLGVVVLGYVLKNTVYPIPEFPFNIDVLAAGLMLASGVAILVLLPKVRRRLGASHLFSATPSSTAQSG